MTTINEIKKNIELNNALFERCFSMRIMHSFQCIKCGKIFDELESIIIHVEYKICEGK